VPGRQISVCLFGRTPTSPARGVRGRPPAAYPFGPATVRELRASLAVVPDTNQVFISRFRCASEAGARSLVNVLLVAGLLPELHEPHAPDQSWEVAAPAELVATEMNLADLRTVMRQAAERTGASFEGCDPEG
jgi:hypothetical protein